MLLGALALASTGCGRRAVVVRDARIERYARVLVREAARDTGCSPRQLSPQQIAAQPAVFTVTGCAMPVEYWLQCGRRGRRCRWRNVPMLNQAAAMPLGCQPQMIQQQPTQVPNTRLASGCGRTASFTMACNGAACGWTQSGPVQGAPGYAAQPPVQAQVRVQAPAAPPPPPSAAVQSHVQAQREAILSCVDTGSVTLRVRWTADGQVIVQLPPELVGTAAEGCIQAVLGGMRIAARMAGELVVPVQ